MNNNHECDRCHTVNSVFWHTLDEIGETRIFLCDKCTFELAQWIKSGKYANCTYPEGYNQ